MCKHCNGLVPDVINRWYVKNNVIHSYHTRGNNLLRIPRGTVNFTIISARVWNVLDTNINMQVPYHAFKHKLKIYLLNNSLGLKYSK